MENEEIELYKKWVDLIEECIERMASNSFLIKKWTIAIVLAAIALIPENTSVNPKTIVICIMIGIIDLWLLDSYYLMLEKSFRKKYDDVVDYIDGKKERRESILSLKTNRDFYLFVSCIIKPSEILFYMVLILICILAMIM